MITITTSTSASRINIDNASLNATFASGNESSPWFVNPKTAGQEPGVALGTMVRTNFYSRQ